MDEFNNEYQSDLNLQTNETVRQKFLEASKWAKFVSVFMFIVAGLILILGAVGGSMLAGVFQRLDNTLGDIFSMGSGIIVAIVVLVVLVITVVYYFLFSFSVKIKNAVIADDKTEFNTALKMLKIFFIATTVLSIISLLSDINKLF